MRFFSVLLVSLAILTSSCTRSDPAAERAAGGGEGAPGAAGGDGSADQGTKPIALTDARLDKYLVYRKEFNRLYATCMKEFTDLAKSVDSKSTGLSKGITAAAGAARFGDKFEKSLSALRAKHGFAADEDDRLWSAVSDVVDAKVLESGSLGDSLKTYREMQAKGGEEKKTADEVLKSFEDGEKQGLAAARSRYGDACVEVLSKRVKELSQFRTDSFMEMLGQTGGAPK